MEPISVRIENIETRQSIMGLWSGRYRKQLVYVSIGFCFISSISFSQDTIPCYHCRLNGLITGESLIYVGAIYGLSRAWYKDPLTNFHFFNDTGEWKQIDKVGHFYTAFQLTRLSARAYRWAGLTGKKAALYAGLTGLLFLTPIEILDGFSPEYGFSIGDMIANGSGPILYSGQYFLWNELRIQPKFSFRQTPLAAVRPSLLGRGLREQWLKDYNGQSYWISVNPSLFCRNTGWLPSWLNISLGYGIQDMVAAETTKSVELGYRPYRQYFLSLDVDFTRIPTRKKGLKILFSLLNSIKVPAPALEYTSRGKFRLHGFYF